MGGGKGEKERYGEQGRARRNDTGDGEREKEGSASIGVCGGTRKGWTKQGFHVMLASTFCEEGTICACHALRRGRAKPGLDANSVWNGVRAAMVVGFCWAVAYWSGAYYSNSAALYQHQRFLTGPCGAM